MRKKRFFYKTPSSWSAVSLVGALPTVPFPLKPAHPPLLAIYSISPSFSMNFTETLSQQQQQQQTSQMASRIALVPTGNVQFVSFDDIPAIGVEGLGGCSVVVIASAYGAILAHIPPLPLQQPSPDFLGHSNVQSMMAQASALYYYYKKHDFFPHAETVIVCAWLRGEMGVPEQLELMRESLHEIGHQPTIRTYAVPRTGNVNVPGQGTVVVTQGTDHALVYVEGEPVWRPDITSNISAKKKGEKGKGQKKIKKHGKRGGTLDTGHRLGVTARSRCRQLCRATLFVVGRGTLNLGDLDVHVNNNCPILRCAGHP